MAARTWKQKTGLSQFGKKGLGKVIDGEKCTLKSFQGGRKVTS